MKLGPGKWRVTLTGDTDAFLKAPQSKAGLWHLFDRWFMGDVAHESNARPWGLAFEEAPDLAALREVDEDDVEAALAGSYVEDVLAKVERAALLDFFKGMIDRKLGEVDD